MSPRFPAILALLACAALQLPWERCVSECHDRVVPAVAEHDCHGHEHERKAPEPDSRHERLELVATTPSPGIDLALPVETRAVHDLRALAPETRGPASLPALPAGRLRTTVLLL